MLAQRWREMNNKKRRVHRRKLHHLAVFELLRKKVNAASI